MPLANEAFNRGESNRRNLYSVIFAAWAVEQATIIDQRPGSNYLHSHRPAGWFDRLKIRYLASQEGIKRADITAYVPVVAGARFISQNLSANRAELAIRVVDSLYRFSKRPKIR